MSGFLNNSFYFFFFANAISNYYERMEKVLFFLLLKIDLKKLLKCYWKKKQRLMFQMRFIFLLICFCSFFKFIFSFFSLFFLKDGVTPLILAAEIGGEKIVQILLDKGANIDHSDEVYLFFFFLRSI